MQLVERDNDRVMRLNPSFQRLNYWWKLIN